MKIILFGSSGQLGTSFMKKVPKKFEIISFKGLKNYRCFNYKIPGDISSSSFFIVLTLLTKKSKILINDVNVNKSRTGIIDILKLMKAKVRLKRIEDANAPQVEQQS